MKRTLILAAVAILLTIFSLVYFFRLKPAGQTETVLAEESRKTAPTNQVVVAPGVVEPVSEEIEVGPEIAGKIREVLVSEGESVTRGQTIAILENDDFKSRVDDAKAQISTILRQRETARAKVAQAEADRARTRNGARREERDEARAEVEKSRPVVENARREFERRKRLFDSGDVSREELDRARTALESAQKESAAREAKLTTVDSDARADDIDRADANVRLAESQLREFDAILSEAETRVRTAEANVEKTIVRAPISGVVLRKRFKDGESVSPENTNGIVSIADVSALRVRVDVDERDVDKIRESLPVSVTADAFGDRKFTGKVVRVGQILGRKNFRTDRPTEKVDTKILEVIVELDPDQKLPLGLRVDAYISVNRES